MVLGRDDCGPRRCSKLLFQELELLFMTPITQVGGELKPVAEWKAVVTIYINELVEISAGALRSDVKKWNSRKILEPQVEGGGWYISAVYCRVLELEPIFGPESSHAYTPKPNTFRALRN